MNEPKTRRSFALLGTGVWGTGVWGTRVLRTRVSGGGVLGSALLGLALLGLAPAKATAQDATEPAAPSASSETSASSADVAPAVSAPSERSANVDPELERLSALGIKTLQEGALDLGLPIAVLLVSTPDVDTADFERQLLGGKADAWNLWLALERASEGVSVRLAAVRPGSHVLVVRREVVSSNALEVSVLRLLRDIDRLPKDGAAPPKAPAATCPSNGDSADPDPVRETDGRAYLAATGAAVGGYTGYALEHITGSNNPRVIYPLMTLGAGVGVAASLVAADEWRISTGEAWYLSAATLWGTASALFIHRGLQPDDSSHRHAYGLLGTATGLSLGTLAVASSDIGQGGALLTESGAIFGGLLGVLTERSIDANLAEPPQLGLGIGLGAGALGAGLLVTRIPNPSSSRVMYVDLSALLGGLTGAAVASPLIVGTKVTELETRLWLGSVLLGTLIGGGLGYTITSGDMATGARAPRRKAYAKNALPWGLSPSIVPVRTTRTGPSTLTWGVQGVW